VFGSGFLIFSDYCRPAIRLSALMELPVCYVFTHDSIGVGEDGPTHQPIEQLISLRAIPDLVTLRPADANEVAEAWRFVMQSRTHPVALILTRQAIPTLDRTRYAPASGLQQGGYVVSDSDGPPELILIASGSEVSLCLAAQDVLTRDGVKTRVVSMASFEMYEAQPLEYRLQVLPSACRKRLAVEAASSLGWRRYVGIPPDGGVIALRHFGASAPWKDLQKHFGLTVDDVVKKAKQLMAGEVTDR
jgi:transketolase